MIFVILRYSLLRTEKAHSSFIGKKFTVGKHHVVVEVGLNLDKPNMGGVKLQ